MDHESSDEENTIPGSPPSASTNQLPNGKHKTKSSTVAVDHNNEEDNKPVKRASSSIAVLIPFRNSNTDDTSSPSRSWPADVNSNSSVPKNSPQYVNVTSFYLIFMHTFCLLKM